MHPQRHTVITYIHTYRRAVRHTYIHTYIHTAIQPYIHTVRPIYKHADTGQAYIQSDIHT